MMIFGNKCWFFRILYIHSSKNRDLNEKTTFVAEKTTFLLKISNNDAMLLPASNIASWAHVDNWNQHPSTILRFSKNADFWQFLKIDFEHHICCHVYDLSNITNWQHIDGGSLWQQISNKCCFPTAPQFSFHLWFRFFSDFDKINKFWHQNNKCCF